MKVTILDGCTACGACAAINSEVFEIDEVAHVNQEFVDENEQDCIDAAMACPVNVIQIDEY